MERLTIKGYKYNILDFMDDGMHYFANKLSRYEDTGLTPEEIIDGKLRTGWIPVTERLPELHRDVLVAVCDVNEDDASTFIDCLVDNNDRPTWSMYNGALDRVLAWMPLPDRYRPE